MHTVSPDFPPIKREAASTPISVINRSLTSAGENPQFEVRGEISHMLSLYQRRQKEPSSLQHYGEQFRRSVEHRRAQQTLLAAKKEAELTADTTRVALLYAESADRAKTEFLANMSHELRTPLNAVIGFAEIIENEIMGPAKDNSIYVSYARDINEAGNHLLRVINDILEIAKIEAGQLDLREDVFDPGEALEVCSKMAVEQAENAGVTLEQKGQDHLPNLWGDEGEFQKILIKLLSNAIKFTPEGGTVTLAAEVEDGGDLKVTVSDTGIGIAAKDLDSVMTPFSQVDSTYCRSHEGIGLGLPISRALVELHGGSLTMESEEGVGTTVTVRFPAERVEHWSHDPQNLDTAHKMVR